MPLQLPTEATPLRDAALMYARMGWQVFPVQARGKLPLTDHGFQDATVDPSRVAGWWERRPDANIGIATGQPSSIVALDVDLPKGGREAFPKLLASFPRPALLSLVQGTGGGGFHVIYGWPGYKVGCSAKGLRERFGRGLEIRGDGGYIVVAPSVHETGQRYSWQTETRPAALEPWPDYLQELAAPIPRAAPAQPVRLEDARRARTDLDYYWRMVLRRRLDDLEHVHAGRNNALNDAAFRMGQLVALGAPLDTIRGYLLEAGRVLQNRGWTDTDRQMENTVDSGLRAGQGQPDRWFRGGQAS